MHNDNQRVSSILDRVFLAGYLGGQSSGCLETKKIGLHILDTFYRSFMIIFRSKGSLQLS